MNCGPQASLDEPRPMMRERSEFGENRSLAESRSRSMGSLGHANSMSHQYHDEPETDYDTGATILYRCIEGKDWDGALSRLELAPVEAKTWVSRREAGNDKIRWRLLPLHAVCIFRAPLALIEALIEVYADGPKMKDDQGMLPVHLACRNGASKGVVLTLLSSFPDSLNIRDRKGRLPVDLVEASNSQNKENVLSGMKKFQRDLIKMNVMTSGSNMDGHSMMLNTPMSEITRPMQEIQVAGMMLTNNGSNVSHNMTGPSGLGLAMSHQPSNPGNPSMGGISSNNNSSNNTNSNNHPMSLPVLKSVASSAPTPSTNFVPASQNSQGSHNSNMENIEVKGHPLATPTILHSGMMVKEVDYEHRTVLFRMVLKKDWAQACARATSFQDEVATWIVTKGFNGNLRFLPLHKACVLQPPANLIEALLRAYPQGAESKDQDGWLPIHCACFYGADAGVINQLLKSFARGANQKDDEGRLPLHYACLKGASQEVVDVLLATSAKGALAKDDEGRLPIHHACSKGAADSVIDALLKASPKGAQSKDDQGRLPLHHACRKNSSERVIRTLLRVYPRAAQIKDDQDKLAIHYACQHGASPAIIHLLLSTYPESINVKNGFGYTPIGEVKALNNPKFEPILKMLEKFKKEHDRNMLEMGESTDSDSKLTALNEKIVSLERTLSKIGDFGKDIKGDLRRGKDPEEILEELADKLLLLSKRGSGTTPLKARQSTPSRSTSRGPSAGKKRSTTPSKGLFRRMSKGTNKNEK